MLYTVRCKGRVLGTTELEFEPPVPGQHSGWFHPTPGAERQLDLISIGYPLIDWWLMRAESPPKGVPLILPDFPTSPECEAISSAIAARLHFVLSLHRADGSELATRDIILQDRHYWPAPWIDDLDPYEGLDAQQIAALDADVEHDIALFREWHPASTGDSPSTDGKDRALDDALSAISQHAAQTRYQVYVRLVDPRDVPRYSGWFSGLSE
ncbi:MAG: hypothetical protein IPP90_02970 [Gemmatimonadaceae bacterium]|nr:hypothetical protein [Gemmatimonadaceae bacterium]